MALKIKILVGFTLLLSLNIVNAQDDSTENQIFQPPIPVEIMIGSESSTYEMVVSKLFFDGKFNFYNLVNYEVDYDDSTPNTYYIQTIVSYNLPKGFGVGVGANLQTYTPFKPLVAVSYAHYTENIGFYIQPSYELHKDGAFELYSLFEWTAKNKKKLQPYIKISAYTSYLNEHSYSYHNWRLGLNYKGFKFGPALNAQYYGSDATSNLNWGGFINFLLN